MAEKTRRKRFYVLLDRDGTITKDKVYQKDPSLTEFFPNSIEGLKKLADAGFGLVMITNQSGIARGLLSVEDLTRVNGGISETLRRHGAALDGVYYCPHHPDDNCRCRKPKPGMAETAAQELGFDLHDAIMIGDRPCDIALGKAIGGKAILVRTGGGKETEAAGEVKPDYIADDLLDAAKWIIATMT